MSSLWVGERKQQARYSAFVRSERFDKALLIRVPPVGGNADSKCVDETPSYGLPLS